MFLGPQFLSVSTDPPLLNLNNLDFNVTFRKKKPTSPTSVEQIEYLPLPEVFDAGRQPLLS